MGRTVWKPGTMLSPLPPAMVTVGDMENPNIITIAWTGIINSTPPLTYISVRKERYSHDMLLKNPEFVINLPTSSMARICDYCGMVSGAKIDKFKKTKLTPIKSEVVSPPQLEECPVSLECKVLKVETLGTHDMFTAEIVSVSVDDQYIDEKGRFHIEKCSLLAFCHSSYFAIGRRIGRFGFSVAKKSPPPKKRG